MGQYLEGIGTAWRTLYGACYAHILAAVKNGARIAAWPPFSCAYPHKSSNQAVLLCPPHLQDGSRGVCFMVRVT